MPGGGDYLCQPVAMCLITKTRLDSETETLIPIIGGGFDAVAIQGTVIGLSEHAGPQGSGADDSGAMFTLTKTDVHAVAVDFRHADLTGDTAHTIQAKKTGGFSLNYMPGVMQTMQVRRLTPVECERLQGFPDGYTNIPWRNKPESPDGPRYKALGNSMAVPVMRWIGERINEVSKL